MVLQPVRLDKLLVLLLQLAANLHVVGPHG